MRFTPHLWERNKSNCLAGLKKKLLLPQDPGGSSSAELPSIHIFPKICEGVREGDHFSLSPGISSFPYLPPIASN